MTYVVRVGEGQWLVLSVFDDKETSDDSLILTEEPDAARRFPDALAAAREIGRVSVNHPLIEGGWNSPLLRVGARVQRLEEAREERDGSNSNVAS